MMSKLLKDNWSYLKLMSVTTKQQQKLLVQSITRDQLRTVEELAANIIYGVLPTSTTYKKQLRRHRTFISSLGDRDTTLQEKRQLLQRKPNLIVLLFKAAEKVLGTL